MADKPGNSAEVRSQPLPSQQDKPGNRFVRLGLFRAGVGLIGAQAVTVLAGMIIALLLARGLGAEGYGKYILALAVMQFLLLPMDFGLTTLVTRQVAVYRARKDWSLLRGLLQWSLQLECMVLCAIAALTFGYIFLWPSAEGLSSQTQILYVMAVTLAALMAFMRLASAILRGLEKVFFGAVPDQIIRPLVLLALIAVLPSVLDFSPAWAIAMHTVAAGVALLWAVTQLLRCEIFPKGTENQSTRTERRSWLSSLMPMGLIVGAGVINSRLDVLMLGFLASPQEVGVYGLAIQISGTVAMAQMLADALVGPRIATLHTKRMTQEIQSVSSNAALLSFAGAVVISILILLFGQEILTLVVGVGFVETIPVALVVIVGFLFVAFLGPITPLLLMTGHEKLMSRAMWVSVIINIVLNFILIPKYGAYGAAMATAIARLFIGAYLWLHVTRLTNIRSDVSYVMVRWMSGLTGKSVGD